MQPHYQLYMQKDLENQKDLKSENDPPIIGFSRKTGFEFLSNFYNSSITFEGNLYPSVEHAYQAAKSLNQTTRNLIKKADSPNLAKRLGQSVVVREDWDDVKIIIMKELIRKKFENPFIRYRLKETNKRPLINENRWNDKFWGVVNGEGKNWLGRILEEVREEILQDDCEE
jgi:ribA/ribD-fused uncharacterized protein